MDLAAYLGRIGVDGAPPVGPEGLAMVQMAHRQNIGFENLDVELGRGISLEPQVVFAKLVGGMRGGYCFEHNSLFGAMLAAMGFANRALLGRVWLGVEHSVVPPRTHTLRLVEMSGQAWIADAGFGGSSVPPLPLRDGAEAQTDDGARHRLRRVGAWTGEWLVERAGSPAATDGRADRHDDWQEQYSFDTGPVAPVDLDMSNHWTSTRPNTRFTMAPIASIVLPDGFASLSGRRLSTYAGGRGDQIEIASPEDWRMVLADLFRIELSAEEVLRLF